jgi:hypothetical protein
MVLIGVCTAAFGVCDPAQGGGTVTKREPTQQDLVLLAQALADFGVEYAS